MKADVYQMMRTGMIAEQLAIEHVRKPCHWMPVAGVICLKGPGNAFPIQTLLHVRVAGHVVRIVIVDEAVPACRPKYRQNDGCEQTADNAQPLRRVALSLS